MRLLLPFTRPNRLLPPSSSHPHHILPSLRSLLPSFPPSLLHSFIHSFIHSHTYSTLAHLLTLTHTHTHTLPLPLPL
ncbi:expressed protein [Echinococcus multilocularis]|uniref:Expressed protein n=1 Tax=Echinococcus multilocularis TaxID=6211 RepID=A0A087VWJ9_ECHMU|nr:expressed protein [Echinococcus multilocularis]